MVKVVSELVDQSCDRYTSDAVHSAPVQITAAGAPGGSNALDFFSPTLWTYVAPFAGTPGSPASHEGLDYVHDDSSVSSVPVEASAAGTVVYVREGCPQDATFGTNLAKRECGAGWGNHVVIYHGEDAFTRYAHLLDGSIRVNVGDVVSARQQIAVMGNSGRSDMRHLHFELGSRSTAFDPCVGSQSFDAVHDPRAVGL